MLPFLFTGLLLLSVSRVTVKILAEARRQFQDIPGLRTAEPGSRPDHLSCASIIAHASIIEMLLPATAAVMAPLIVGFGFGQRALIAMLISAIGTSYMMGTMMSNAGESWGNAQSLIECRRLGKSNGTNSDWHKSAMAGHSDGDHFISMAGPALSVFSKLIISVGLVTISLMEVDQTRGWIGAILFATTIVFMTVYGLWVVYRAHRQTQANAIAGGESFSSKVDAPPRQVSPFYSAGAMWDPHHIAPGSQMHDAMVSTGNPHVVLFDPSGLPGMSTRDSINLLNLGNGADNTLALAGTDLVGEVFATKTVNDMS
jgi:Inorganic H+ pyrophosphatase